MDLLSEVVDYCRIKITKRFIFFVNTAGAQLYMLLYVCYMHMIPSFHNKWHVHFKLVLESRPSDGAPAVLTKKYYGDSSLYIREHVSSTTDARWHGINHAFFYFCFHDFFNTISLLFRLIFLYWKTYNPHINKLHTEL
jgi:hypothetical protein